MILPFLAAARTEETSVNVTDTTGRSILSITPVAADKGFSLSLSGFEINFGSGENEKSDPLDPVFPQKRLKSANQKYRTALPLIEFGLTAFPEGEYRAYTPDKSAFMEYKWIKSSHIQWNVLRFSDSFNRRRTLGFNTALGLSWDRYTFNNYLLDESGIPMPAGASTAAGRTKINTFSLNIPVLFGYTQGRLSVGAGVYGNFVLSRKTKVSRKEFRENVKPYVNKPQAGATFRIKFRGVSLFANYAFTNLFESGTAPDVSPLTFGIGIW